MNTILLSNKTHKDRTYFYVVFFWSVIIFLYKVPNSLDLYRYYESVKSFNGSVFQLLAYVWESNLDFIYLTSLKILYDLGIPMSFGTAIYVSFYFLTTLTLLKFIFGNSGVKTIPSFLITCICLAVPFSWVICVSRSTAAFCFLFLGLYLYIKKNYKYAAIFAILSVLTHVSMLIFILLIVVGVIITPVFKGRSKSKSILMLIFLVVAVAGAGTLFSEVLNLLGTTSLVDTRYNSYLGNDDKLVGNFLLSSNLSKGERAHIAVLMLFFPILLLQDKKRDMFSSVLLLSEIMMIFFNFTQPHVLIRTALFALPFFAVVLCRCYINNPSKRQLYNVLIYLSIICELWEFFNSRPDFF